MGAPCFPGIRRHLIDRALMPGDATGMVPPHRVQLPDDAPRQGSGLYLTYFCAPFNGPVVFPLNQSFTPPSLSKAERRVGIEGGSRFRSSRSSYFLKKKHHK